MPCKFSFIILCWLFTCKDVLVSSIQDLHERSPSYVEDETKFVNDFDDIAMEDDPNQEPEEQM